MPGQTDPYPTVYQFNLTNLIGNNSFNTFAQVNIRAALDSGAQGQELERLVHQADELNQAVGFSGYVSLDYLQETDVE